MATKTRTMKVLASENGKVTIRVAEGKKIDDYLVERIPADFGEGFRVVKISDPERTEYAPHIDGIIESCDCWGHTRHGHCRHLSAVRVLVNRGDI